MQSIIQEFVLVSKYKITWKTFTSMISSAMSPLLLAGESSVKNKDVGERKRKKKERN